MELNRPLRGAANEGKPSTSSEHSINTESKSNVVFDKNPNIEQRYSVDATASTNPGIEPSPTGSKSPFESQNTSPEFHESDSPAEVLATYQIVAEDPRPGTPTPASQLTFRFRQFHCNTSIASRPNIVHIKIRDREFHSQEHILCQSSYFATILSRATIPPEKRLVFYLPNADPWEVKHVLAWLHNVNHNTVRAAIPSHPKVEQGDLVEQYARASRYGIDAWHNSIIDTLYELEQGLWGEVVHETKTLIQTGLHDSPLCRLLVTQGIWHLRNNRKELDCCLADILGEDLHEDSMVCRFVMGVVASVLTSKEGPVGKVGACNWDLHNMTSRCP